MKTYVKPLCTALSLAGLLFLGVSFAGSSVFAQAAIPVEPSPTATTESSGTTAPASSGSIADNVCRGLMATESGKPNGTVTVEDCTNTKTDGFDTLVQKIINIFSVVVGSVSVIMIIIGGFRYIISGGDSAGVTSAKNTILYAVVGLVIVLFSQVIVRFIISVFS